MRYGRCRQVFRCVSDCKLCSSIWIRDEKSIAKHARNMITSKAICDAPYESFLKLDPLTRQYLKHYSISVTGVPSGAEGGGVDSEEPFVFPAPGEDLGNGGDGGSVGDGDGDGESDDSLFG